MNHPEQTHGPWRQAGETSEPASAPGREHREHPTDQHDMSPADTADPAEQPTESDARLIERPMAERLQRELSNIQSGFVDDPRSAVDRADRLAGQAVDALQEALAARKRTLDEKWQADGDHGTDTERMRQAIRGYRDLVEHVLTA